MRVNSAGSAAAAAGHASVRICTCKIYRDQLVLQVYCLTLVCAQLLEQIQCEPGAGMLVGDREPVPTPGLPRGACLERESSWIRP